MRNVHRWKHSFSLFREVLRQGRLHILPLGFITILAGAASTGKITPVIAFKSILLSVVTSFVASAPNDYFDADIDADVERKKITGSYVQDKNLGRKVAVSSVLLAVLTAFIMDSYARFSLLSIVVLSVLYSVPPFRFKGRAPLDSICNGLGAFFVFGIGVGLTGGGFEQVIPGAYWFTLIVTGVHGISAIPDMEQDRKEGLRTLPMLLGKNLTIGVTQLFVLIALYFENFSFLTSSFLVTMFLGLFVLYKEWDEINLNYMLILGVIYCTLYFAVYAVTRGVI